MEGFPYPCLQPPASCPLPANHYALSAAHYFGQTGQQLQSAASRDSISNHLNRIFKVLLRNLYPIQSNPIYSNPTFSGP